MDFVANKDGGMDEANVAAPAQTAPTETAEKLNPPTETETAETSANEETSEENKQEGSDEATGDEPGADDAEPPAEAAEE